MIDQETRTAKVVKFLFLGFWLVITVFPLYWIVVTSFKKPGAIFSYPLTYWPEVFSIENYLGLFSKAQFGTYVVNSLIVATIAAVVATFISMLWHTCWRGSSSGARGRSCWRSSPRR